MNTKSIVVGSLALCMALTTLSCKKSDDEVTGPSPYLLGVGITTSSGGTSTTTNYVVKANSLMDGVISPLGNGLTLIGYRDYSQGNNTVFAVGGFTEANVNGINQDGSGNLMISGSSTFDAAVDDMQQVDNTQMLALRYPSPAAAGNTRFYFVDINSKAINANYSLPVTALKVGGDNPVYSGMVVRGDKLFVSHLHFAADYATNYTDTNYVAVYSYPALAFEKLIKDTRTGPTGAWQTKNGLFKTENGDIYAMSSSNISNGYSKSTKPGGFLRIKNGETEFDASYFFQTEGISHIKYIGNGKLFATVSTLSSANQTRWQDLALKMAIIDVVNQTVTDVTLEGGDADDLIHDGNGGRSFPVLVHNGKVYYTATIGTTTNIYQIDPSTHTAKKGAQVDATFVGGIFKVE